MTMWADGRRSGPEFGCRSCKAALTDENWTKSLREYRRYICTPCWTERQLRYYHKDPDGAEKKLAQRKARQATWNADRRDAERRKAYSRRLKKEYGITLSDFDALHAAQEGKCAVCSVELRVINITGRGKNDTHVDHCHETGKVRGLLCSKCNQLIGLAQESISTLTKAAEYLMKNRERADHKLEARRAGGKKY